MDINRFEQISKAKGQLYSEKVISAHLPTIKDSDYKRGYIERYFIQKSNDTEAKIIEVDFNGFRKFSNNPFYNSVSLEWRLKGEDDEIKESNLKSVKRHYAAMPKLQIYLPNLLQFRLKKDL
jgi:hypothetical protein